MLEFATEAQAPPEKDPRIRQVLLIAGVVVALLAAAAAGAAFWANAGPSANPSTGSLQVISDPAGAEVRVDGVARGVTPLTLTLDAKQYQLTLQQGTRTKLLPVTVTAGVQAVHHVSLGEAPASSPAVATGGLDVSSDNPGSRVTVDGTPRGVTPLALRDLTPGQHEIVVTSGTTQYRRTVQVEPGATAALVISNGARSTASGWLSVTAPVSLQIFEGTRLVGTSDVDRIMLPSGNHDFEFVAESLGFRATRSVTVSAGQTAAVSLQLPRAPLSINAVPWAEVFVDGERVGETPLANLMQSLGSHEIVFRHPQFGERRLNTVVTLRETARVSVDMRAR